MDDRTPGYDEPDRDELTRPLSLSEWDYLGYVRAERNRRTIRRAQVSEGLPSALTTFVDKWDRGGGERLTHKWRSAS